MSRDEPTQDPAADTGGDPRRRGLFVAVGVVAAVVLAVAVAVATLGGDDAEPGAAASPTATAGGTTTGEAAGGDGGTAASPTARSDGAAAEDGSADAVAGGTGDDAGDGAAGDGAERPGDGSPVAVAVCSLTAEEIAALTRIAGGDDTVESLRDGITVLESRITALEVTAEQEPRLQELARLAREVRTAWRDAVAAEDAGDGQARDAALRRADQLVARAGDAAESAGVADCR